MEAVPAGVALAFDVTYDSPDLFVAMTVVDTTSGSPIVVQGPRAMTVAINNTYTDKFTPTVDKSYVTCKAVYTDETYETLDTNYFQGSDSFNAVPPSSGGGGGCEVVGLIVPATVVGFIDC